MVRHLLSIAIAFVASVVAFPLAWWSGATMWRIVSQFHGAAEIAGPAVLLAVACVLLLAVGGSIWLSALGALLAGAVHLLAGLSLVLWPFDPIGGSQSPVLTLVFTVFGPASELGIGATVFIASGAGLVGGAVLLGAGIAALARTRGSSAARVPLAIAGTLVLLVVMGTAAILGGTFYREVFVYLDPTFTSGLLLILLALVAGAVALTTRWTAVPLVVAGVVTTLLGIVVIAVPRLPFVAPSLRDLAYTGQAGTILVLGALVLGTGLGVAFRSRRRADANAPAVLTPPPPTGQPSRAV